MSSFTIIVPVFEETYALVFSQIYFSSLGLHPLYVLDSKKVSRRIEVENLLGREVEIYENSGHCIEAGYENLANVAKTDWILRVDCDEAPNKALLEHAARFVLNPTYSYCAYDRDDIIWRGTKFERLKYAPLYFDSQFRLFNRREVKFVNRIHTPGFHVPRWKPVIWPAWHGPFSARLYHLNREFVTSQQLVDKTLRYNAAGQHKKFENWYSRSANSFKWLSFDDNSFNEFFSCWKAAAGISST